MKIDIAHKELGSVHSRIAISGGHTIFWIYIGNMFTSTYKMKEWLRNHLEFCSHKFCMWHLGIGRRCDSVWPTNYDCLWSPHIYCDVSFEAMNYNIANHLSLVSIWLNQYIIFCTWDQYFIDGHLNGGFKLPSTQWLKLAGLMSR